MEEKETISKRKKQDENYLFELQKFLDIAENITDIDLRRRIVAQMLKCDEALTKLMEKMQEN